MSIIQPKDIVMRGKWENDLRKRMETHEEPSPEGLWNDIEESLRKEKKRAIIAPVPLGKEKIIVLSKRMGAVAAIAIVILSIGLYKTDEIRDIEFPSAAGTQQQGLNMPEVKPVTSEKHHIKNTLISLNRNTLNLHQGPGEAVTAEDNSLSGRTRDLAINAGKDKQLTEINIKKQLPYSECRKPVKISSEKYVYSDNGQANSSISDQKPGSRKKLKVSTFASNLPADIQEKYNGARDFSAKAINTDDITGMNLLGEDPFSDILIYNRYTENQTSIKHRQPIAGGLNVNYGLNERWSITSGVTYALLSSMLRSGSDNNYYKSEQTLHYVGIPLSICYNVWGNKNTSLFLSGGGNIEKNISGKLTTEYIIDDKIRSGKEEKISVGPVQWSLNVSGGIQYSISERVFVYSEPGVSYYFKNNSKIETIYKERPLNFCLRFGISFKLN